MNFVRRRRKIEIYGILALNLCFSQIVSKEDQHGYYFFVDLFFVRTFQILYCWCSLYLFCWFLFRFNTIFYIYAMNRCAFLPLRPSYLYTHCKICINLIWADDLYLHDEKKITCDDWWNSVWELTELTEWWKKCQIFCLWVCFFFIVFKCTTWICHIDGIGEYVYFYVWRDRRVYTAQVVWSGS